MGGVGVPRTVGHRLDVPIQIYRGDVVGDEFSSETFGLLTHFLHQLRTHDSVREPRIVLDVRGVHQCTTGGDRPFENQRIQLGPGGVHRGGIAGRTGPNNDEILNIAHSG